VLLCLLSCGAAVKNLVLRSCGHAVLRSNNSLVAHVKVEVGGQRFEAKSAAVEEMPEVQGKGNIKCQMTNEKCQMSNFKYQSSKSK
jgi:hypothetical protein